MDIETMREFCLSLPQVSECFPFDEWTLVFKVEGKMFLFCPLEKTEKCLILKCAPERAIELRERYSEITPGYHMNKRLWITIALRPSLSDSIVKESITHAYTEVVKKLPKTKREPLLNLLEEWKKEY